MEIKEFKNIHRGERVFILGNGPSLQQTPLEKLDDEYTIAMNKINLIYTDTDWRPSYFIFHDAVHEDWNQYGIDGLDLNGPPQETVECIKETIELGIPCFLSRPAERWFGEKKNVLFYSPKTTHPERQREIIDKNQIQSVWSDDITEYITSFASSITISAQIAAYLGFTQLYFLGCDLYEPTLKQRLIYPEAEHYRSFDFKSEYKFAKLIELLQKSDDGLNTAVNTIYLKYIENLHRRLHQDSNLPFENPFSSETHFTEDYDSETERSARSLNEQMRRAHKLIKFASEEYGFEVYNATVGGHLEVYERVELSEIL